MRNTSFILLITTACLWSIRCAPVEAPSGWLPDPEQVPRDTRGGWIRIESSQRKYLGELIAVARDTIFVADTTLHAVPSKEILSARLVAYDVGHSMGGNTLLGALSTISNGLFLVFTMPMWIVGGSIAAASRSFDPIIDYPDKPLRQFALFARYPQGLPDDLRRDKIKMKAPR